MNAASRLSLTEAAAEVRSGRCSSRELVDACLLQIERWEPHISALPFVMAEEAREAAASRDAETAAGRVRGSLHGVPIVVKDLIDVAGAPTEANSRVLAGTSPPRMPPSSPVSGMPERSSSPSPTPTNSPTGH